MHRLEARRIALDKEHLELRLKLMRAQIEPHFLFNALANVRRLCRDDVEGGIAMLANLGRYLRAAWPQWHDPQATLAQEAELVAAYLGILKVRMGPRLSHVIDIPEQPRKELEIIYVKRMDELLPLVLAELPDLRGTMIGAVTPPPILITPRTA